MGKIITINSNKGGEGKSTTCLNLAYGLASHGKKVLLVDNNPQANITALLLGNDRPSDHSASEFLANYQELKKGEENDFACVYRALEDYVHKLRYDTDLSDVFDDRNSITKAIHKTRIDNLDIIPSSCQLAASDLTLKTKVIGALSVLRLALAKVRKIYDYIIIDNSPMESSLSLNAIAACHEEGDLVIIPTKIDRAGLEGTYATLKTCYELLETEMLPFDVKLLITMKNRNGVDDKWIKALQSTSSNVCFQTVIRYQAKPISSSSLEYQIVSETCPNTSVGQDYLDLTREILSMDQ